MTDVWEMIDDERTQLADLGASLTPEQWDAPSLCDAWRVRDVMGHLVGGAELTMGQAVGALLRYRFRLNTMLHEEAIKAGSVSDSELVSGMRAAVGLRRTPPGVKAVGTLVDTVVHRQDIRRALGLPAPLAQDHVRIALDELKDTGASILPGKKRVAGLHLSATDMDWSVGDAAAPDVSGTGEALLMAMAGRSVALADLAGLGVDTLRART